MTITNPKARKLIDEALYPNEPILWQGRPGGKYLTTGGKLFMGIIWLVLPIGFLFGDPESDLSVSDPKSHLFVWSIVLGLTAFIFLIDKMTRRNTLYVITDRRILLSGKGEDGWMLRAMVIKPDTRVWYTKRWNAIHIHTPTRREGLLADWWNRLRINGFTFNDVEDPEQAFKLIKNIIAHH